MLKKMYLTRRGSGIERIRRIHSFVMLDEKSNMHVYLLFSPKYLKIDKWFETRFLTKDLTFVKIWLVNTSLLETIR